MLNINALRRELREKTEEGIALIDSTAHKCKAEDRGMTDEERAAQLAIQTRCLEMEAQLKVAEGDEKILADLLRLRSSAPAHAITSPAGGGKVLPYRSMGTQFVSSAEYQQFFLKDKGHRSSSSWRSPSVELMTPQMMAATLTEDAASGGALVLPQYLPGIQPLFYRRPVIADLLAPGTTDSNLISYMRELTFTNAAAAVLEGGTKPESAITFEAATDPVRKLAHWLPVTEEMLEDVPQIRSYIDARLTLGIQLVEETQLLSGNGTAPNISGILDRAGLTADMPRVDPDTNADVILKQHMAIFAASFLMPTGYVMHPTNWTATILVKNENGDYLTAGPFAPIQAPTLWGLPVVLTPVITADTALVGAFNTAAQVFRRGGIRVEASNSHSDFFIKNLVAIRAEERLALAVYRPAAFGTVSNLA